MEPLTNRQERILRAVIVEYINTANPVPSDRLAESPTFAVKSATIRAELGSLSERGLLEQTHKSAGRVPSDQGYRYYVDHLMKVKMPTPQTKTKLELATLDDTLRTLLQETVKLLARMTHLYAAAATLRDAEVRVLHTLISAIGSEKALLVMVLDNGHVENRLLDQRPDVSLDEVGAVNQALAERLGNQTLGDLRRLHAKADDPPLMQLALGKVTEAARDLTQGWFISAGKEYVLSQPDFHGEPEMFEQLVNSLDDDEAVRQALMEETPVTIGQENTRPTHRPLAFARRRFQGHGGDIGLVAIIGPRRMDYDRSIGLLEYTADAISSTLARISSR